MFTEPEFNEFEPRPKSAKNRFQMSNGLNHEKLNIIKKTNHIEPCLNFFKFGLS